MKRFTRVLALLLAVAALPAVATDKAKAFFDKGRDAEARQDYETAYNYYHQAYEIKPADLKYRTSFERVRFLAAASYVHRGELLLQGGKLQEALTQFEQAIAIDPSSFIAQQQANRTRELIRKSQGAPPGAAEVNPTPESQITKRMEEASGPVELTPISPTPLTMKMSEDPKTVYESIGKLAGINVLFDPDYNSSGRRIRVDLNGVTVEEAP